MNNKIVVVTGGSTGIGSSICEDLNAQGYQVINISDRASQTNAGLTDYVVDLTDQKATQEAAKEISANFEVTTFVHNAGAIRPALLADVSISDVEYLEKLHIHAPIILQQAFLPAMKTANYGRVVLISSRAASGLESRTGYSATKAGMLGMARTWSLELAPFGITVNVVAPGPVAATEMFHEVIPANSDRMRALADSIPVRRLGLPEDISRAVTFFTDPGSGFITGQTLYVCGGTSVGSLSL